MDPRDDEIEFDFFEDEPPTREEAAPRRRLPTRGGNGPRRPLRAPTGLTPLLRLTGLIAFAIFIVVVLVLWVQGCRDSAKTNRYKNYMAKVSDIAKASAASNVAFCLSGVSIFRLTGVGFW